MRGSPARFALVSTWVAGIAGCLLLAACGGGGGGGTDGGDAAFLTADPRGMTAAGAGLPDAGGPAAPDAPATDAAGDLAREIEEADLVRVEGDTLYLLNAHRGLTVVDLASFTLVGRVGVGGFPHEMFVRDARALVLATGADGEADLVDVSLADPSAPAVRARLPLGGVYRASRIVGDVLYAATDSYAYPSTGGTVRSFSVAGDAVPSAVDAAAIPGGAAFVHATDSLLAVAGTGDFDSTPVTLVDVSDPTGLLDVRGSLELPGWVSDEFKLHVAGDVLRVVTHSWEDRGLSRLFTIDVSDPDAPSVLATLPLARGEQLFATRFTDTAAYLVTFEQVDPLWIVDLSNPAAPFVAGSLVVPGWSTHLVPLPGRLVAIGVDATAGWHVIASLFDVSNPAAPALLDREDFGWGWSSAFSDVKALGVFPADGLVTVPVSSDADRLAVLDLASTSLTLRGSIELSGPALRGFPHPRGIVAVSSDEVVVADRATLAVLGSVTVAEDVVDAARLPDGRLLSLVRKGQGGRLGGLDLPLVPDRLYPHGFAVAVTGWDDAGRAAYVVDFSGAVPAVSERFDLGGAWYPIGMPAWGAPVRDQGFAYGNGDALLTADGRLVVHGLPGSGWWAGPFALGEGAPPPPVSSALDGFVVIDVPSASLEAPVDVDGYVTGFAVEGEALVYTVGGEASPDALDRPRMRHDLVRLDLVTRASTASANVPGWVVAASSGRAFTVEERWTDGWSWECSLVAVRDDGAGGVEVLSRLALPEGAYDLRAAGATLFFTTTTWAPGPGPEPLPPGTDGGGASAPVWMGDSGWLPATSIRTVRLSDALLFGPSLDEPASFVTLLLAEDGSALVTRDGMALDRYDLSGPSPVLSWSLDVDGYPVSARADSVPGTYLVALGYAGLVEAP